MGMKRYHRQSAAVIKSKRWRALRIQALRRDGFACIQCGARGRLEVDHIRPVRDAPDQAYDLNNLQTLCRVCHSRKTRIDIGFDPLQPDRQRWRAILKNMGAKDKRD